jgi:hypothetical protein
LVLASSQDVPERETKLKRREFIATIVGAAGAVALALPVLASDKTCRDCGGNCRKIGFNEFTYGEKFSLYMLHNRMREGQRFYVWLDETRRHGFTVDDKNHLAADRNWICLGELRWVADAKGEYFEHHLVPNFPRIN